MKTITELLEPIKERLAKATPGLKVVERQEGFSGTSFRYEVNHNDKNGRHCLVLFYEENHKPWVAAKGNAVLFANAPTDIAKLIAALEMADAAIERACACVEGRNWTCMACKARAAIAEILKGE